MRTAGTLEILETAKESRATASQSFSNFYVFTVKFGSAKKLKALPAPPLFRPSQIIEMNVFGAATEGDAFE